MALSFLFWLDPDGKMKIFHVRFNSVIPLEREEVEKKAEEITKLINLDNDSSDDESPAKITVEIKTEPEAPKVPFWVRQLTKFRFISQHMDSDINSSLDEDDCLVIDSISQLHVTSHARFSVFA